MNKQVYYKIYYILGGVMPQLSLYVDQQTLEIVEKMAKMNNTSISKWVCTQIKRSAQSNWPDNFFNQFGALADTDFGEVDSLSFESDSKREEL